MISHESIMQLKAIAKVSEVVETFIKLKRTGSDYVGNCPFHNEKTPSFKIPVNGNFYKCFGCGESGDVFAFVMKHTNCGFNDAVEHVARIYNFELEKDSKDYVRPVQRLEKIHPHFIKYFEDRGISNNTLLRFKISQSFEWMPKAQKETNVVCFNYFRNEELINIKFRGPGKDFKLAKDAELIFYNIDAIKDTDTAVIVEGEIDAMSLYEAGIYNVVSVPNGTTPKGVMKLPYLDNCAEYFIDKKQIIIATDNDQVGQNLKDELARRFGIEKCSFIQYPSDCKDANDVLIKHGADAVRSMIEKSIPFPIKGIVEKETLETEIFDLYENGYPEGVKIGIESLDKLISFMPGDLTTITGIPGSGKSEFTDWLMAKTSVNHGWKWAVCSFENSPPVFHATKLIEKLSEKPFNKSSTGISKFELEMVTGYLSDNFFFINTMEADITIDGILAKTAELVLRKGIKGLLIDPWNYIEHKVPNGYTETQYISDVLSKIRMAARKLGIHIFLIAHPTKLQKDKATGKYEVPTMYSISGSANFFNKTDNGLTIYRDFETNVVTAYVQKIRWWWIGKIGFTSFSFNTLSRQYEAID
jgi:twinkle protein